MNNNCHFCQQQRICLYGSDDIVTNQRVSLQKRLTISLYNKYAESQNYYYTKDINEIILDQPTKPTIVFKDIQLFDEQMEYLKKLYTTQAHGNKMKILTEFYKFHKDLPRWAVVGSVVNILNEYYNTKRKLDYYKIQKIIQEENQMHPDKPPKGIVGDRPLESQSYPQTESDEQPSNPLPLDNLLDELQITERKSAQAQHISVPNRGVLNSPKMKTDRGKDPFVIIQSPGIQKKSVYSKENIQNIKQLVYKQRKQLLIQDPDQCEKLEPQEPKTRHQQILEQLNQRVNEKIYQRKSESKQKLKNQKEMKREVFSVHFDQNKKENFFKSPRTINNNINNKKVIQTPKSSMKKMNTFHNDGSNKKLITAINSARIQGSKTVHQEQNKQGTKKLKKPIQFKTLTTPRSIQQK